MGLPANSNVTAPQKQEPLYFSATIGNFWRAERALQPSRGRRFRLCAGGSRAGCYVVAMVDSHERTEADYGRYDQRVDFTVSYGVALRVAASCSATVSMLIMNTRAVS